ncbi:MAG: hypothetical protein AAFP90_16750 [Planctomycetota bacterium]
MGDGGAGKPSHQPIHRLTTVTNRAVDSGCFAMLAGLDGLCGLS